MEEGIRTLLVTQGNPSTDMIIITSHEPMMTSPRMGALLRPAVPRVVPALHLRRCCGDRLAPHVLEVRTHRGRASLRAGKTWKSYDMHSNAMRHMLTSSVVHSSTYTDRDYIHHAHLQVLPAARLGTEGWAEVQSQEET